jgi:arginyl-tRNA synthetase
MEKQISLLLQKIIQENYSIHLEDLQLKFPPKKDLGDFAFNCARLSRDLKKSPLIIAEELSVILKANELIDSAELSGPYINLKISKTIFTEAFK